MKVLMYQCYGSGGHHKYGVCLSEAISEQGVEVHLVTARSSHARERQGLFIHPILLDMRPDLSYLRIRGLRYMDRFVRHWWNFRKMVRMAISSPFDLVHLQVFEAWPNLNDLLLLCHQRPVVLTIHNVEPHWIAQPLRSPADRIRMMAYRMERKRHERARQAVKLCIVHARSAANTLQERFSVDPKRIRVIPFGPHETPPPDVSSREDVAAFAKKLDIAPEDLVVLFFGEIRRNKGLHVLLDAWPKVLAKFAHARLLIAGEPRDAFGFAPYARQIAANQIASRVSVLARRLSEAELTLVYQLSHLSVLPYLPSFLAQSGVLFTAFAHGHPVIASNVGAVAEVIQETEAGILVPAEDPRALASAIVDLLSNAERRRILAENGVRALQQRYTWKTAAELTVEAYRTCLAAQE